MKICIVSGNPKKDGRCRSFIEAINLSAADAGAEVLQIELADYKLLRCQVCSSGWGICRNENKCAFGSDGFDEITNIMRDCDAFVFATPVYWGEMSELLKCFIDRLRRCDFNGGGILKNKQALLVACAGGTGNGLITCLEQMDRFCRHCNMNIFDYIGANRWNSDYTREAAKAAAFSLASGRKNTDTI